MMWVSIISTAINIIGATAFWLALPEKIKTITASVAALEIKVQAQETESNKQGNILARIDERTSAMKEDLADIKRAFAFRGNGNPKNE